MLFFITSVILVMSIQNGIYILIICVFFRQLFVVALILICESLTRWINFNNETCPLFSVSKLRVVNQLFYYYEEDQIAQNITILVMVRSGYHSGISLKLT